MKGFVQIGAQRNVLSCVFAFCVAALILPWIGPGSLSLDRVLHNQAPDALIFVQLRVTRTLLALFAGGALSLGGTLFQAVLRDALATPYTLGVSTGASLGAVIVICLGWQTIWGCSLHVDWFAGRGIRGSYRSDECGGPPSPYFRIRFVADRNCSQQRLLFFHSLALQLGRSDPIVFDIPLAYRQRGRDQLLLARILCFRCDHRCFVRDFPSLGLESAFS